MSRERIIALLTVNGVLVAVLLYTLIQLARPDCPQRDLFTAILMMIIGVYVPTPKTAGGGLSQSNNLPLATPSLPPPPPSNLLKISKHSSRRRRPPSPSPETDDPTPRRSPSPSPVSA